MSDGPAPRLAAGVLVSALIRRVQAAGGFAAVLHRGDEHAGGILVECAERGAGGLILERGSDLHGRESWRIVGDGVDAEAANIARAKRLRADPDAWVIELDIADAERFAAEILSAN